MFHCLVSPDSFTVRTGAPLLHPTYLILEVAHNYKLRNKRKNYCGKVKKKKKKKKKKKEITVYECFQLQGAPNIFNQRSLVNQFRHEVMSFGAL